MNRQFNKNSIPSLPRLSFDWSTIGDRPASLEIGCGTGDHALLWARQNPSKHIIAIERTKNKFARFAAKIKNTTPYNLSAIHADAVFWGAQNFNKNYLFENIFILYPNPYPKNKQANLRFANMPFFGFLLEFLQPGGKVILATNLSFYAEEVRNSFVNQWGLDLTFDLQLSEDFSARTAFEKKYLERLDPCFELHFQKKEDGQQPK